MIGLIPEPPFDLKSWSGSSVNFFGALKSNGLLSDAYQVSLSGVSDKLQKLRAISPSKARWKERWHSSVPRFRALTRSAKKIIDRHDEPVIQVGAWFSSGSVTKNPCYSYHDGNAAQWYKFYGRGLLPDRLRDKHLAWEREVYSKLTGIFVMSSWLADSFVKDFGVSSSKVHVVGAGINDLRCPEMKEPIRPIPRTWPRFDVPRFLMVGKDFERKGGRYLLEAFRILRREVKDAELVLVGPSLSIKEPGVICTGFLQKNIEGITRMRDAFLSATAVVLPSIYEPFGISLTEGMAYGLPAITVNRCAMQEIVQHGRTGLVVQAEDSQDLAKAMIQLAKNPAQCEEFGGAGRKRFEENFTWSSVASKIKDVVDR